MRTAGCVLLACAAFAAAAQVLRGKRLHLETVGQLCLALELIRGELAAWNAPIPQVLEQAAGRANGEIRTLFSRCLESLDRLDEVDFSQIWRAAVEGSCHSLKKWERDKLVALGSFLGRYDLETQLCELRRLELELRKNLEQAERSFPEERRLWLTLGATGGLLIAIVLL